MFLLISSLPNIKRVLKDPELLKLKKAVVKAAEKSTKNSEGIIGYSPHNDGICSL